MKSTYFDPRAITVQGKEESEAQYRQRSADGWREWHERNYQLWKKHVPITSFYGSYWPAKEREFQARLKLENKTQPTA